MAPLWFTKPGHRTDLSRKNLSASGSWPRKTFAISPLRGGDGFPVLRQARAQDLLIPKESEGLRKLGPKNFRHKSAARGGWLRRPAEDWLTDLLILKESEGLGELGPKTCGISPLRWGAARGWLYSPGHRTYLCRKNLEDLLKNFQAGRCRAPAKNLDKLIGN